MEEWRPESKEVLWIGCYVVGDFSEVGQQVKSR